MIGVVEVKLINSEQYDRIFEQYGFMFEKYNSMFQQYYFMFQQYDCYIELYLRMGVHRHRWHPLRAREVNLINDQEQKSRF